MHCPNCGVAVESEQTSFCTRCGQQLDRVRDLMKGDSGVTRQIEISHAGLNLGVGLMYAGMWPALAAVITSPIAIPAALLMLVIAFVGLLFGSGPLLRLFQTVEVPKEIERTRRREIAFGATLMFLGTIISAVFVAALVPDSWIRAGLVIGITGIATVLMASSKTVFLAYRGLTSADSPAIGPAAAQQSLTTGALDDVPLFVPAPGVSEYKNALPPGVTEPTTRQLDLEKK